MTLFTLRRSRWPLVVATVVSIVVMLRLSIVGVEAKQLLENYRDHERLNPRSGSMEEPLLKERTSESLKSDLFLQDYVEARMKNVLKDSHKHPFLHFDQQGRFAVRLRVTSESAVNEIVQFIEEHGGVKQGTFRTYIEAFIDVTLFHLLETQEKGKKKPPLCNFVALPLPLTWKNEQ